MVYVHTYIHSTYVLIQKYIHTSVSVVICASVETGVYLVIGVSGVMVCLW